MASEDSNPTGEREKGMTAGQRLAAAKAAKAAAKASKKGQDADLVQQKALAKAAEATDWYEHHRVTVLGVAGAVLAVSVGLIFWNYTTESSTKASGSLLWDAVETAQATIRPAGSSTVDYEGESFDSVSSRAKEALTDYRAALKQNGSGTTAQWATLGEASELLRQGDFTEARAAFDKAHKLAEASGASAMRDALVLRAQEGIGFTYEGEKAWDKAEAAFADIAKIGTVSAKNSSAYNVARVTLAKGDRAKATELFKKLYEDLNEQSKKVFAERTSASPDYELAETEERLRELDPSAVRRAPDFVSRPGSGGNSISQEELQRILKQLQEKSGQQ